jgi:rRNA maturation protein Nop10
MSCTHTYEANGYHGPVQRKYTGLFCPECGERIEAAGPTRPFKLKPHQR